MRLWNVFLQIHANVIDDLGVGANGTNHLLGKLLVIEAGNATGNPQGVEVPLDPHPDRWELGVLGEHRDDPVQEVRIQA